MAGFQTYEYVLIFIFGWDKNSFVRYVLSSFVYSKISILPKQEYSIKFIISFEIALQNQQELKYLQFVWFITTRSSGISDSFLQFEANIRRHLYSNRFKYE